MLGSLLADFDFALSIKEIYILLTSHATPSSLSISRYILCEHLYTPYICFLYSLRPLTFCLALARFLCRM